MASKNKMGLLTLFNIIAEEGLTPNQFYLLFCTKQGLSVPKINVHQEIRYLVTEGWLKDLTDADGNKYIIEPKALTLISKAESFFGVQVKASNNSIMGDDFEKNVEKYNNIFPRAKSGNGKAIRSPLKEVLVALRWFFENYQYSWETIFKAAEVYVEEGKKNNFRYTRTSKYFVRKQENDKSFASDLAAMCDLIDNGEEFDEPTYTEKVF